MEKTACQNARVEILIANTCNCVQKKEANNQWCEKRHRQQQQQQQQNNEE